MANKKNVSKSRATTRTRRLNLKKKFITASNVEDATDVPKTKAGEGQTARDEADNPRLILDINSVQKVITNVSEHSQSCSGSLYVRNKSWKHLEITCCVCELKYIVGKESDPHEMALHDSLVVAAYCAGVGYTSLKTIFNCLECPFICNKTYRAAESRVGAELHKLVETDLANNLMEAKQYADKNGEILEVQDIKYPYTSVIVDGGWAKRSYGHSYSSNAGVAVIISEPLQKVLHMGYRVKTCKLCDEESEKEHACFKNWSQSAQAMEADIIATGFQECFDTHGIIFKNMIGDADSSVHAKVQGTVNYPGRIPINKVDCANHGVRGLNSRIFGILSNANLAKNDRDAIRGQQNRFGKDVRAAIAHNNANMKSSPPTSAATLAEDIINIPRHVFGEHCKCRKYFCKGGGVNIYTKIESSPAGKELIRGFHLLANRSFKLIADTTSNRAELFMSIMNKMVSGKRINYAQRGGYANRCCAAVLTYNHGKFWPGILLLKSKNAGPCKVWKQALKNVQIEKKAQGKKPTKLWGHSKKTTPKCEGQKSYGVTAAQGTLTEEELNLARTNLVNSLQVTAEKREKIRVETFGQCFSDEWKYQRRNRITASNSGRIFRLSDGTNNSCTLKSLLYPRDLSHNENIIRGINMEPRAKQVYSFHYGVEVQDCGLFVSLENGVLAASPDGLIGDDGILEVKSVNCKPEDVPLRKCSFLKFKDKSKKILELKENHIYYFQVIQQLYVCDRNYCDFMVYFEPEDSTTCDFWVQRITKTAETSELWSKMKTKLVKFFELDVAAEIVDPTLPKSLPFRQPKYREEAIEQKARLKLSKSKKKAMYWYKL